MPAELNESLLKQITATGRRAISQEEKCRILYELRSQSPEAAAQVDKFVLGHFEHLQHQISVQQHGLHEAQQSMDKMKEIHEQLTEPPWYPAVVMRRLPDPTKVMVAYGNNLRIVNLAEDVDVATLNTGDEVFLNNELNLLLSRSPWGAPAVGETATFLRRVSNERLVLRSRDDEVVVEPAQALREAELEEGDQVRWDRSLHIAYEEIEHAPSQRHFISEIPDIGPEQVGGQRAAVAAMLSALTLGLANPVKAELYGLSGRQRVLMVGPQGCGKTTIAKVAAAELSRLSGKKCHFAVVQPGGWEDPYVGVTQRNIRNCFEDLKQVAERDGFAVLFLDEIESIGRIRGSTVGHHSDKFLGALLAEIEGFENRGNLALVAATNRKDLLDPALLERLSGVEIQVSRPDMMGAREIFQIHLRQTFPFSPNGELAAPTRQQIIDRAVSRLFDPNAENQLCTIQFRDSKTRNVSARDLISGRIIAQICQAAQRSACLRDIQKGDCGIRAEDMDEAVCDAIARLRTTLTPHNVRSYLSDLPQDVDVVSVEPIVRRVKRTHRYLEG